MRQASKAKRFLGYRVLWLLMSTRERWTIHEVAHEIGCAPNCAYRHLRELWSMEFIHIAAWDRTYHHWMPVYQWGNRPDKERPAPLTQRQIRQRKKPVDSTARALKCVYMAHRGRGNSWREALGEDVASG